MVETFEVFRIELHDMRKTSQGSERGGLRQYAHASLCKGLGSEVQGNWYGYQTLYDYIKSLKVVSNDAAIGRFTGQS